MDFWSDRRMRTKIKVSGKVSEAGVGKGWPFHTLFPSCLGDPHMFTGCGAPDGTGNLR